VASVSKPFKIAAEVGLVAGEIALGRADAVSAAPALESGLVERCIRGDGLAFSRLVALHEGMVVNLALRLLGDREEARDLAQDVFLQVFRTLGRFEGRSSLKTWIYRITVNQCRNRQRWWRRRRRDRALSLEQLKPADEARLVAPGDAPFQDVERRELALRVQAALLKISFDHRSILVLREVEGMSCEEIATTLGLPEGTVKSRLARARDGLRRVLAPLQEVRA
jgi:RNA polymerase sigma-70 factor (ECF subfamily)